MKLRDYQSELYQKTMAAYAAGKRAVIMQCPTGGGKTVMFNHAAAQQISKGSRVLIIADRRELIAQAARRFYQSYGLMPGIILAGTTANYRAPIQVASIQTLTRRTFPPDIDFVIIDECRGSIAPSYEPVWENYSNARFMGVDATPIRTNGQGFEKHYDELVLGPSIQYLEGLGSLVPASVFVNQIDRGALSKMKLTAGDYNEKALAEYVLSDRRLTADLVASKIEHAPGMPCLTFAVNIEHSLKIVEQYKAAGISAAHVDGNTEKETRNRIFKGLASGQYEVVSNVGIATYGIDIPELLAVQLARPTKSVALYLQMAGRGTRPFANKKTYVLLDHANCIEEHGAPNRHRVWSLYGDRRAKTARQTILFKKEKEIAARAAELPEQVSGKVLISASTEDMEFMATKRVFDEYIEKAAKSNYKPMWAYYRTIEKLGYEMTERELKYISDCFNFRRGWVKIQLEFLEKKRAEIQHN